MEKQTKKDVQVFLDNLKYDFKDLGNYIADNTKQVAKGVGLIAGLFIAYKVGQASELNQIIKSQSTTELTQPYHGFNPKVDISNVNAEQYLLDMDRGDQFKYHGKKITLLKRIDDEESDNQGYNDYFMIGNQINIISTGNLNSKTIDNVFGDSHGKQR